MMGLNKLSQFNKMAVPIPNSVRLPGTFSCLPDYPIKTSLWHKLYACLDKK